jgi:tetratricopeptide (TPR) repeat protein
MAHLYRGSSDLALADLTRAIALAESDARLMAPADLFYARRSRASINDSKRQYDQEIADYTALVQSYLNDPALVASLKANYGDAGAANMLATIYRQRALAALHLSDSESAIADLTDAIPLSSDRGYSALIDRARIHESRGERAQAIADLQTALDVRPGSDEARLGLKRLGASPSPGAPRGM